MEEYERFQYESPRVLTDRETEMTRALATNLPAVWNAPSTNASDKQEVIRCLVERISVEIPNRSEGVVVVATITWVGGAETRHQIRRPVLKYSQLENFAQMRDSIASWRNQGRTNAQIAEQLNEEGYRPPSARATQFTRGLVAQLVCRLGLAAPRNGSGVLGWAEWWLRELAEELRIGPSRLRDWIRNGYIHWRKLAGGQYVVWADGEELVRLAQLRDWPLQSMVLPERLTHPKPRPKDSSDHAISG